MSTHNFSYLVFDKDTKIINLRKESSWNGAVKTRSPHKKNEIKLISTILYKNKLQIDQRSKHETWNTKLIEENIRHTLRDTGRKKE